MTAQVIQMPTAVRVGGTHVSVAQAYSGRWVVVAWSREAGPSMLGDATDYDRAVLRARSYALRHRAILDIPEQRGEIHVLRLGDMGFQVLHESSSGESFATLRVFGPHERDQAVQFAIGQIGQYSPCRLGRVEP